MPIAAGEFTFHASAGGDVTIRRGGRVVTVLRGRSAGAFLARVSGATDGERQRAMARVTGNYRRGNERLAASHRRRTGG
jgi:hypothetical protein